MRLKSCKMLAVPVIILFMITVWCADFLTRGNGRRRIRPNRLVYSNRRLKTAPAVPEPVSAVVSTATLAATGDL